MAFDCEAAVGVVAEPVEAVEVAEVVTQSDAGCSYQARRLRTSTPIRCCPSPDGLQGRTDHPPHLATKAVVVVRQTRAAP